MSDLGAKIIRDCLKASVGGIEQYRLQCGREPTVYHAAAPSEGRGGVIHLVSNVIMPLSLGREHFRVPW